MKKESKQKEEKVVYSEDIVEFVKNDYLRRRDERETIDRQWKLNLNFVAGNQYAEISPNGEILEEEKYYGWQSRSVFNHIAPIIDIRLAKLSRVRPTMSVRAKSSEESDLKTAVVSSDLLSSTVTRIGLDKIISKATSWSEVCGSCFYKVLWNKNAGKLLGEKNGEKIYEGDVEVVVVPPFEIFPD